jgi:hypothetical protein
MPIIAAIVVLVLAAGAAGWYFFLRPMAATAEYRAKATAQLELLKSGAATLSAAYGDFEDSVAGQPGIDEASLNAYRTGMEWGIVQWRQATAGIRGLQPPAEYAETQKQLIAYADLIDARVPGVQQVIAATAVGESFESFQTRLSNADVPDPKAQAVADGFAKACETLGFSTN